MWDISGIPHLTFQLPTGYAVQGFNNRGQAVGYIQPPSSMAKAFVWDPMSGLTYLGPANRESRAMGINDLGQIVGSIYDPAMMGDRAVIWNPVPEPSSLIAFVSGLGGLALLIRPRQRQS